MRKKNEKQLPPVKLCLIEAGYRAGDPSSVRSSQQD